MSITVSIETALALKEAGWVKECEFSFLQDEGKEIIDGKIVKTDRNRIYGGTPFLTHNLADNTKLSVLYTKITEAPTAEEILEELKVKIDGRTLRIIHLFENIFEVCFYTEFETMDKMYSEVGESLREALAKLWINHPECRKESIAQKDKEE